MRIALHKSEIATYYLSMDTLIIFLTDITQLMYLICGSEYTNFQKVGLFS